MLNNQILILGATGYTGRLISYEFLKANLTFTIAGRNQSHLDQFCSELHRPSIHIDLSSPVDFAKIPADTKIIVNCAGPFNLYALGFLEYLDSRSITYLDISGEESFVFESFSRLKSKKTKARFVHAVAFESFFAEALAVSLRIEGEKLVSLNSYYYFGDHRTSPGTRLSMQIARFFETYCYENNSWVNRAPAKMIIDAPIHLAESSQGKAVFAPYPEILFFASRFSTQNASSFLVVEDEHVFAFKSDDAGIETRPSLPAVIEKHRIREGRTGKLKSQLSGKFKVAVVATLESGVIKTALLTGENSYVLTALLMTEYVQALLALDLAGKLPPSPGFYSPDQLLPTQNIFQKLIRENNLKLTFPSS